MSVRSGTYSSDVDEPKNEDTDTRTDDYLPEGRA